MNWKRGFRRLTTVASVVLIAFGFIITYDTVQHDRRMHKRYDSFFSEARNNPGPWLGYRYAEHADLNDLTESAFNMESFEEFVEEAIAKDSVLAIEYRASYWKTIRTGFMAP